MNKRFQAIKSASTDSETPQKLFPIDNGPAPLGPNDKITMEVEYYDVIYTKHIN